MTSNGTRGYRMMRNRLICCALVRDVAARSITAMRTISLPSLLCAQSACYSRKVVQRESDENCSRLFAGTSSEVLSISASLLLDGRFSNKSKAS
ncbi:hypothetical protein TNCV_3255221 [Trichonephila clavipes]|nr:hypothetical protein TNCV_3255221 [Trichonephila clavipes]